MFRFLASDRDQVLRLIENLGGWPISLQSWSAISFTPQQAMETTNMYADGAVIKIMVRKSAINKPVIQVYKITFFTSLCRVPTSFVVKRFSYKSQRLLNKKQLDLIRYQFFSILALFLESLKLGLL